MRYLAVSSLRANIYKPRMVEILYQQNDSMLQDDEKICISIYILCRSYENTYWVIEV